MIGNVLFSSCLADVYDLLLYSGDDSFYRAIEDSAFGLRYIHLIRRDVLWLMIELLPNKVDDAILLYKSFFQANPVEIVGNQYQTGLMSWYNQQQIQEIVTTLQWKPMKNGKTIKVLRELYDADDKKLTVENKRK